MGIKALHIIGCFVALQTAAQRDSIALQHFNSYEEKVTFSTYLVDTSNSFTIAFNTDGQSQYLTLNPNKRVQLGAALSYKLIDLSYGFSPGFFNENKDNGSSKLFSLNLRFQFKKWVQNFSFINQKGFYAEEGPLAVYFPDMRTTKWGSTTAYVFNDRFSFKTLSNQNQWQTQSAGSFIPNFSVYYTQFDLNDGNAQDQSNIWLFSLAPSYYYNWVLNRHFLCSLGLLTGIGFNAIDQDWNGVFEAGLNSKIGYNSDSFFTFVTLNHTRFFQDNTASIQLSDQISTLRFAAGYRFDPPKKVKEMYQKASQKIGLP